MDARILVDHGAQLSFAKALRQFGVPPEPLGLRVAEMERAVGVEFFDRTTHAVTVTEMNGVAIDHVQRILSNIEGVQRSVAERCPAPPGRLRL